MMKLIILSLILASCAVPGLRENEKEKIENCSTRYMKETKINVFEAHDICKDIDKFNVIREKVRKVYHP